MTLVMITVLSLVGLGALYLARRIARTVGPWREPTTTWVRRSPTDRRQHILAISMERRRGPRREDDIAHQFLAGVRRPRRQQRAAVRG